MTAATEQMGISKVFPRQPMEILFKDRYFVSDSGSDITKDPALVYRAQIKYYLTA